MNTNIKRIFLGGGAFGCIYHIGVIKALYKYKLNNIIIYGNSAGALLGLVYILKLPIKEIHNLFDTCAKQANMNIQKKPYDISSYQLTQYHFQVLKYINDKYPNAYKLCSQRFYVGVTNIKSGFEWKSNFKSNLELFNTLLCSFNVPYLCNYEAKIDNELCIDGGFGFNVTKNLPKDTISVSLYDLSNYDLNANIPLLHRLKPPDPKLCKQYVKNGYKDMKRVICGKYIEKCDSNYHNSLESKVSSKEFQSFMCDLQYITDTKMQTYKDLKKYLAT